MSVELDLLPEQRQAIDVVTGPIAVIPQTDPVALPPMLTQPKIIHRRPAVCYPLVHNAAPKLAELSVAMHEDYWWHDELAARLQASLVVGSQFAHRMLRHKWNRLMAWRDAHMGHRGEPMWPQLRMSMFEQPRRHRSTARWSHGRLVAA